MYFHLSLFSLFWLPYLQTPVSDDTLARMKAEHEEEMQVLVDTAEEESNSYKAKIAELEQAVRQAADRSTSSSPEVGAYRRINSVMLWVTSAHICRPRLFLL